MKRKSIFKTLLLFSILAWTGNDGHAEATKEIIRDAGIYATGMRPVVCAFNGPTLNFSDTSQPGIPEGQLAVLTNATAGWGSWGIFSMTPTGDCTNFNIVEKDFSEYVNGSLRVWLKSTSSIDFTIEYGQGGGSQSATRSIPSTGGNWIEIILPLSAPSGQGGFGLSANNLQRIRAPFISASGTNATWYIDHVRWTKPVASLAIFPSTVTVQQGKRRQFTVEGRDAVGERVIINSSFSAVASVGTFNPLNRVSASTLTANTSNGVATGSFLALSTSAAVSVVSSPINEVLGLYSETILTSIQLNTDSLLNIDAGNVTAPTLLDESSTDSPEGVKRLKTTLHNQPATTSYSGWTIQWNLSSSDALIRDMSRYYDGSLRFWFKGPSTLQNNLQVGIRSGNTEAGTELSKVLLKNYVAFDNAWHSVVIPMQQLAGARPWADISRTKILISVYAIGIVSGDQDFYMDNIRWDTNLPGPLVKMAIAPDAPVIPLSGKRRFVATGFDANNTIVDVFPHWTVTNIAGSIGSVSPVDGVSTLLSAGVSEATGTVTATQGAVSTNTVVYVRNISFTQSFNVYSDNGSSGFIGISSGIHSGTTIALSEPSGPGVPEGTKILRANYSLVNNPGVQDAFAIWYSNYDAGTGSRFMRYFDNGYLSFWVKTTKDLQVAIRSVNIPAGTELSKFRLSELGIPTDDTWQKVVIALSEFKARDPRLDFDHIQTYFAIGALSSQIGPVASAVFDVDDVKWLTSNPGAPDANKVYIGLTEKQMPGGLVKSFDNSNRAVTYDQSLVAMNFTYRKPMGSDALSKRIFDVYKYIHDNYGGPFNGFHNEYNVNSAVGGYTILDGERTSGPNAWMLLALIHYRNVTGQATYDTVIDSLATWLQGLQAADGAVQFGRSAIGALLNNKSTEHNFDCYAAFTSYALFRNNNNYRVYASSISTWLNTQMYVPAQQRFKVGIKTNGNHNWDRALDAYSWAPLALSSFTNVLTTAENEFQNTKSCDLTGISVIGFDFSGQAVLSENPPGSLPDNDSVWLEGTAQMALAFYLAENTAKGDFYLQELDKTIVNTSANGQGMAYATNVGTAYGFMMDSVNPAASSMAWYLFAKTKFNPFKPFPLQTIRLLNAGSGVEQSSMTWSATIPTQWVRAEQVLKLDAQPISALPAWLVQIYTDNTNSSFVPRFVDPTPGVSSNKDSNPVGLLRAKTGETTTYIQLNMAWSIKDTQALPPTAENPSNGSPTSFQWIYLKDRATPTIPELNTTAFVEGETDVVLRKLSVNGVDHVSHGSQGDNFFSTATPDYVYFQADFSYAAAQAAYKTNIIVEFLTQ